MIAFGETLRKAREDKGLTTRQIADATHMMIQTVEDLENENFSKIAAPIYGRGFVKLYCETVGIDPKPLVDEFMDIYNGNRTPTIRMRPDVAPAPEATESADAPPTAEPPASEPSDPAPPPTSDLFGFDAAPAPAPKPVPSSPEAPAPAFVSTGPSRYAAPMPLEDVKPLLPHIKISIPPTVWRLLALVCAAGLILWLLGFCMKALYNATMLPKGPAPATEVRQAAKQPTDKPASASKPEGAPRQPRDIPPLYID